jgi:hypothetical protein
MQLLDSGNTIAMQVDLNAIAGVGDDTWYHYRITFDCTPDTYEHWLDATSIAAGVAFDNPVTSILTIKFIGTNADSGYYNYIDAIGYSWDTSYNIGDNCFWRNYKEATDSVEDEDWGTTGTSIAWVDSQGGTQTVTINPEFNEHKKVLDLYDNNAADHIGINHTVVDETFGSISFWMKTSDATSNTYMFVSDGGTVLFYFKIDADQFQYYDGGWSNVGLVPTDNTWYHIRIDFKCHTGAYKGLDQYRWQVWIDNVQYGVYTMANDQPHIDNIAFYTENADSGYHYYLDAITLNWDVSYQIADNRTFEYNAYSYDDVTNYANHVLDLRV